MSDSPNLAGRTSAASNAAKRGLLLCGAVVLLVAMVGPLRWAAGQSSGVSAGPGASGPAETAAAAPTPVRSTASPIILILGSYERPSLSSIQQVQAIEDSIALSFPHASIHIHYLARPEPRENLQSSRGKDLADLLRSSVGSLKPELVVVVDMLAFRVVTEDAPDLFRGVPMVFSGVVASRIAPDALSGRSATGVFEVIDAAGTLNLMLRLQPGLKRVLVISKGSDELREIAQTQLAGYEPRVKIDWARSNSLNELRAEVNALGPGEAALVLSFVDPIVSRDRDEIFRQPWDVPVYSVFANNINHDGSKLSGVERGAIGGRVISYPAMGRAAGALAVRVLRGEDPQSIPPIQQGGLTTVVDYRQLKRLGIPTSRVPLGVTVHNRPSSFLGRMWPYLAVALVAVAIEGAIIGLLIRGRRRLRRVQATLTKERERYKLAVSTATESVWDWDIVGDSTVWSGRLAELMGLGGSRAEAAPIQTWSDCLHPEDRARVRQALDRHLENDAPYAIEYRLRMAGGEYRWYASRGQCLRDATGRAVRMTGTLTDITDRVEVEQRRAQSEERFRTIFERHAYPMWVYDRDTLRFVAVNDAAVRTYGYSREEFAKMTLLDIRSPSEVERLKAFMSAAPSETEKAGVWRHRTRSGREIDVLVSTSSVAWLPGRNIRLGTFVDVTDKLAAERLRDHQNHILELVASEAPVETILEEIILGVERQNPDAIGSIVLLNTDGQTVATATAPNLPPAYGAALKGARIGPRSGSCGTAMFTKSRIITSDIATDPLWDDHRSLALSLGLRACWSEPIVGADGEVLGSFGMYYRSTRSPSESETQLIATAGRLAGIAIDRRRLERSVQDAEARFRALIQHNAVGIAQVGADGRFMLVNARACEILGRSSDELIGRTFTEITHPDDVDRNLELLRASEESGDGYRLEKRYLRPDGQVVWANVDVRLIRKPDGRLDYLITAIQDITEARESSQRLAESEGRYRRLLNDVRVIAWEADAQTWLYTFVAGQAEEITGYPPEQWLSEGFWPALLHPEDRERAVQLCTAQTGKGLDHEFEYRIVRRDGGVLWMRDLVSVEMLNGRPYRIRGVMIDITAQKQAETELEQFYRLSPVMLCTATPEGYFERVNPAFSAVLGYSAEELYSRPYVEFVHPDDRGATAAETDRLNTEKVPGPFENRYLCADGQYRWISWNSTLVTDTGRVYAAARDVTKERAAAEALRRSEAKYRQIVETAEEGIWVIDPEWTTTFVNARMAAMIGRRPEEMLGRHLLDFVDDEGRGGAAEQMRRRGEGIRQEHEFRFVRPDGTFVWTLVRTNPITDDSGAFAGALAMVTDITSRREAEEAVRRERRLFLGGPAVAWRWRNAPGWPVEYVSSNVSQLGYAADDFISGRLAFADLVHPDDIERVGGEVAAHVEAGDNNFQQEYRLRSADGRWIWLSDHTVVERGPDGAASHFSGYTFDITARKRADEVLSQQQREYATLVSNLPDMIFRIDRSLRHVFAGGAVATVSGRQPEEFVGRTVREMGLPALLCDQFEALCREVFETGEQRVAEIALADRWVHYQLVPERDSQGTVVTLLGLIEDITQQRRAAEALRASEERYRQIVETAQEGIWLVDTDWKTSFVNARMAEMIGLAPRDMIGRHILDFCDAEGRRQALRNMQDRESGMAAHHEFRFKHADGRDVWTLLSTNAMLDPQGKFVGALAMVTDITARRAADLALRESESTNRALLAALPDLLFRVDADGRYLDFKGPPEIPLIVPPEKFLGRTMREVLPAEMAESAMRALGASLTTGQVHVYEYQTLRNDRRGWWEGRVVPIGTGDALILVREITQRREAEEALRDSQRRLVLLITQAPIGVIVWNTRFEILQWNPSAQRIFGFTPQEAVGKHGELIVPPEVRPSVAEVWRDLMAQRGGMYSVNENITRSGERIICEWNNTPLVGAEGTVIGVSSFVQDVTERVMSERRQALMMQELDHRVKNNMAAVLSLAEQTGRSTTNFDDFQTTFMGRVRALARMHNVLAASRWQGADLSTLVRQTVEPYSGPDGERLDLEGPPVSLPPRAAQSLAMTLNELATNASKHGALSAPGGKITLRWSSQTQSSGEPDVLTLQWIERGGPPTSTPQRRGLGIDLIEGAINYQLGGKVEFRFPTEGLECVLVAPVAGDEKTALPTGRNGVR